MNPSSSTSSRAVVITGITVYLAEQLKHSLHIKFVIDGGDPCLVLLKQKEKPTGERLLPDPIHLREGSILSIKVKEKHRIRDKTLAKLDLSLEEIWPVQEPSTPDARIKRHRIFLPDTRQQIWLNISIIPSSSETSSTNPGRNVRTMEPVSDDLGKVKALESATLKLREFKRALDYPGRVGEPIENVLKIPGILAELLPAAKAVAGGISMIYDEFKNHDQHHKEVLSLAENMTQTMALIPPSENVTKLSALRITIQSFHNLLDETVKFIEKWLVDIAISKVFNVTEHRDKIARLEAEYNAFKRAFSLGITIDNLITVDDMKRSQDLDDLKKRLGGLVQVKPRAEKCLEGTRENILSNVEDKIQSLEEKNVIWISGAPGSGKSSVSLTIKSRLHAQFQLVTYFRFDRTDATVTTSNLLWSCVAYDLADRYPSVLEHNLLLLRENGVNLTSAVDIFNSLIKEPLSKLADSLPDRPLVIVIDALDECGGFEGRSSSDRKALRETLKLWPQLPKFFKLLVTSRDEGDINHVLSPISTFVDIPSGRSLTEDAKARTSVDAYEDIRTFLQSRFQDIKERIFTLPTDWPGEDMTADMVHHAAGNFMWATTALIFVESGLDPQERLKRIMDHHSDSMGMSLYSLYFTILEISFGNLLDDESDAEVLRAVLGAVVFAQRPLQDGEYTSLPTIKPVNLDILATIRDRLRSVIERGPTIRFVHKSFDDFLLSSECPAKYAIRPDKSHQLLTNLCLTTMTAELHFNICDLETSCLKNVDVPDIEIKLASGISTLLSYSCCYWAVHLSRTSFNTQQVSAVKDMLFDKLLYWFEAMSLLKEIGRVSYSLLLVLNWVKLALDQELNDFIRDAHQFIGAFGHPISQSAPHVYISALPFSPEDSPVLRQFLSRFPRILEVPVGKPKDWSPCIFSSEHHRDLVWSIAFSPDEKYFVSGSMDAIVICDSEMGNPIAGPFRTTGIVVSCFFDPEGRRVWAQSKDGKIFCWDVETGDEHLVIQAGGSGMDVLGCCYFNGGRNILSASAKQKSVTLWNTDTGERLRDIFNLPSNNSLTVVSSSPDGGYVAWAEAGDMSFRIWNVVDGKEIHSSFPSQPHFYHAAPIYVLCFSTDGHCVVSGSEDGDIVIWDVQTGETIGDRLATGQVSLDAVAYSHENKILVAASGNPGRMMVWNTSTHEVVLGPLEGHTCLICRIALSRDGQRVLSAGDDTVKMWDLRKKNIVPTSHAVEEHKDMQRIIFSPCGKKLASLDVHPTIRVWDVSTGQTLLRPIATSSFYTKLIFASDGGQVLAFDSANGTLHAWNVDTGKPTFNCDLTENYYEIKHVAFRSTDQRLITCSSHGVVRLWSVRGSSLIEYPTTASSPRPEESSEPVVIMALSPDGVTAMVHDYNRTPHYYLWSTTTCQALPVIFTDDTHISGNKMVYSPSGKLFAVASLEGILRVWNIQTGDLIGPPSVVDGRLRDLVFLPDECHIASCYDSPNPDRTGIWIWNTRTGCLASGPWKAHSDAVISLALSPDGGKLASGSLGGQIAIWNTTDLLEHLPESVGFLNVGTCMRDGWVTDKSGNILFWVPQDHRLGLVWPGSEATMGGRGTYTRLDLTKFRYGKNWVECFGRD